MNITLLQRLALFLSIGVILLAGWFWSKQIQSALELLEMAYG